MNIEPKEESEIDKKQINNYPLESKEKMNMKYLNKKLSDLSLDEQISMYLDKIQQLEKINKDLKFELLETRSEQVKKIDVITGLRKHLNEKKKTIFDMKKDQIDTLLKNEQLENEKAKLINNLNVLSSIYSESQSKLKQKDDLVEQLRVEIQKLKRERDQIKMIEKEFSSVSDTLDNFQKKEVSYINSFYFYL